MINLGFDDEIDFLIADGYSNVVDMRELTPGVLDRVHYCLAKKHDRARSNVVKLAYGWAIDRLKEFLEKGGDGPLDTPIDPVTLHACVGGKPLARFIEEELDPATLKILARERAECKRMFQGYKIPSDGTIIKFYKLVSFDRFQKAINVFTGFYRIAPARVKVHKRKDHPDYHGEYRRRSKTIHLYRSGLGTDIERVRHLCHEFFHHLANEKSWYFHDNPRVHKDKEEGGANRFRSDIIRRLERILRR